MSKIIEHQSDDYVINTECVFITRVSNAHRYKSPKGWQIVVTWKYMISTWDSLKDLK